MKKLVSIIVGGTGQLGVCLSQELLKNNNKVIITTRSFSKKTIKIDPKVKILKLNIYNKIQIKIPLLHFFYEGSFLGGSWKG